MPRKSDLFQSVYVHFFFFKKKQATTLALNPCAQADEHGRSGTTNSNCRPSIPGMYAARKRNKQDDCDRKSDLLNKLVSSSTRTITKFHNETKHNVISWSYDVQGHVHKSQTCVEPYCERANKTADTLHTVSMPCLDDHQVKKEELETVGELSEVCS